MSGKNRFFMGGPRGGPNVPKQLFIIFGIWMMAKMSIRNNKK